MPNNHIKNQHLLWRAGFGPGADDRDRDASPADAYAALRAASSAQPGTLDVIDSEMKDMLTQIGANGRPADAGDPEMRRMLRERSRAGIRTLNLAWMRTLVHSPQQLREKMAFFWHGHFASRNLNLVYQQQLLDILRKGALGSFRDLLQNVSKSASMLNFLNAQQNRKGHPNENFAREVMELFTLGRGHYSEHDIKEAARAFTGWGANFGGEFVFRKFQHDEGSKTVLGKTGNLTGEDVLNHLLDQPQTARYVTEKIYRFFVNDTVDAPRAAWLAERFYKSGYDIQKLLDDIFTSNWFYDAKNIGTRIKSPVELLVGMQRTLPMEVSNEEALLLLQRVLGQTLFYPPNVAGWPGGRSWIDSSTLMMRMRIPLLLNEQDDLNVRPKSDDDVTGGKMEAAAGNGRRSIRATIDWPRYAKPFEGVPRTELFAAISGSLLQQPLRVPASLVQGFTDDSSRDAFVKSTTLKIMSLPEYQMC